MKTDPLPLPPEGRADTTGSRWAEIKLLFESALALDSSERDAFLEQECGGNEELRLEVYRCSRRTRKPATFSKIL